MLFLANVLFQNQCYHNYYFAIDLKGTVTSTLNNKITSLTAHTIKSNNLGKIINILSADMGII
jgi:hypothetical protein